MLRPLKIKFPGSCRTRACTFVSRGLSYLLWFRKSKWFGQAQCYIKPYCSRAPKRYKALLKYLEQIRHQILDQRVELNAFICVLPLADSRFPWKGYPFISTFSSDQRAITRERKLAAQSYSHERVQPSETYAVICSPFSCDTFRLSNLG